MQEDLESVGQWKLGEKPTCYARVVKIILFYRELLFLMNFLFNFTLSRFGVMVAECGCMQSVIKFPATILRSIHHP